MAHPIFKTLKDRFKHDDHALELLYVHLKNQYPQIHRWYAFGTNISLPLDHPCRQLYFKHGRYLIQHGAFATHMTLHLDARKVPSMRLYQSRVDKCLDALYDIESQCRLLSQQEYFVGLLRQLE
ncbi:MAG TPA: hypothetical protein VK158_05605 [Acidobacteriota bacterium]|nr:hypothetical protein [Acidobacteriota bacterium]